LKTTGTIIYILSTAARNVGGESQINQLALLGWAFYRQVYTGYRVAMNSVWCSRPQNRAVIQPAII
jgi:hypothetical protein